MPADKAFVQILVKRHLATKDRKGLASWLRRCAKNIESGKYDECRKYILYEKTVYNAR